MLVLLFKVARLGWVPVTLVLFFGREVLTNGGILRAQAGVGVPIMSVHILLAHVVAQVSMPIEVLCPFFFIRVRFLLVAVLVVLQEQPEQSIPLRPG